MMHGPAVRGVCDSTSLFPYPTLDIIAKSLSSCQIGYIDSRLFLTHKLYALATIHSCRKSLLLEMWAHIVASI